MGLATGSGWESAASNVVFARFRARNDGARVKSGWKFGSVEEMVPSVDSHATEDRDFQSTSLVAVIGGSSSGTSSSSSSSEPDPSSSSFSASLFI